MVFDFDFRKNTKMIREIILLFCCLVEISAANICEEIGNIRVQEEEKIIIQAWVAKKFKLF